MLPKGEITREQLSQLLLVYIGMASDIMDLFVLFKEDAIRNDRLFCFIILAVWGLSLMQFTFVSTATGDNLARPAARVGPSANQSVDASSAMDTIPAAVRRCGDVCGMEMVTVFTTVLMQDGPFLAIRLIAILAYPIKRVDAIIFFTSKNFFIIILQMYRFFAICMREHDLKVIEKTKAKGTLDTLKKRKRGK